MSDLSLRDATAEVCARVKEVLKALPPPEEIPGKHFSRCGTCACRNSEYV